MEQRIGSLRRSALYVPATNKRAMQKARSLDCDALIFDLEDAVAPAMKETARQNLVDVFAAERFEGHETVIRVNAIGTGEFNEDLKAVATCRPNAFLVPKVSGAEDFHLLSAAAAARGMSQSIRLWVMIETATALGNIDHLVASGLNSQPRLDCLVVGTNDLAKETGVFSGDQRWFLFPWLMNIVLAGKRHEISVLDGVWNDFADEAGFAAETNQAVKMAFNGKTLIHPCQVDPANRAFSPSEQAVFEARMVAAAFAKEENLNAGVINLNGKMTERLHLVQAHKLLEMNETIQTRAQRKR